ncbi:MAG: carboxylesterase family protein [bacterium]
MRFKVCLLSVVLVLTLVPSVRAARDCGAPVETEQGPISGMESSQSGACVWKGVRYAAPPTGDLRLRAPRPPEPHQGVYKAHTYAPACPQNSDIYSGGEVENWSEDCLAINIWSPKKEGSYPVMFWIHGGGMKQGSGSYGMSNGARLAAERDVVVVTVDYRLNNLGFLTLPELVEESPNNSAGNYGLLDQVRALKWLQKNISSFGGDPDRVTIFGQSAGAGSVYCLMTSPLAEGLFHRAIPMSGFPDLAHTMEQGFRDGQKILEELGCDVARPVECLRAMPAEDIIPPPKNTLVNRLQGGVTYAPHMDGYFLSSQPIASLKEGDYNRVPVMVGHTRDEVKLYTIFMPGLSWWPKFMADKLLEQVTGSYTDELMQYYSYDDYKKPMNLVFDVLNEGYNSRGFLAAEAMAGKSPVYLYRFDWDDVRFPKKMGAFHGMDEPFVFGAMSLDSTLARIVATKESIEKGRPLSEKMMSYYTNFARTGDPNGEGLPEWPAYNKETHQRMHFDTPPEARTISEEKMEKYEFFSQFYVRGITMVPAGSE